MLGRGALLAAIMTFGAFTGCIGGEEEAPPVDLQEEAPSGTVAENQTAAPDGRGELAAFKETNRTVTNGTDAMEHKHDYWGAETRKIIYQEEAGLIPLPLIPDGKAPGTAIADFDIPEPSLVYEGTSQLELVFTKVAVWGTELSEFAGQAPPEHPHVTIFVDYLTAEDEPGNFHPAGQATPGEPLIIPVKATQADMPHQTKSLWLFRVYTGEANAWTYNLTITAVKGYEVVDWPPHPDLYAEKSDRVVFEGPTKTVSTGQLDNNLYGDDASWTYPEKIISYGTDKVEVFVERGAWKSQAPEPSQWRLEVNNASYLPKMGNGDPAGLRLEDAGSDGTSFHFEVPVDAQGYDTPYGTKSRWAFRLVPWSSPSEGPEGATFDFTGYELEYTMKIVASGHSIEAGGDGPKNG